MRRRVRVTSDSQFMRWRAHVVADGVQHQIFKVDGFTSIHGEAQASVKCMRTIQPSPTGERAMRSSRLASAMPAPKRGCRDAKCTINA